MDTVWVLTSKVNAYDQYGEYFEHVFKNKPTAEQISPLIGSNLEYSQWVVDNKGRKGYEDSWYNLEEVELL